MDTISYESYRWRLTPLVLPGAKEYLRAINNISLADIVLVSAWSSNTFFEEACQMLANSINLYQQGFFDAAFYSLRQSIELSIGTLYLNAKPDDLKRWVRQEDGFEVGRMSKYLKENEIVFKDVREKMSDYFNYGYILYTSDVEPNDKEMICNQKEYDELFSVGTDFNIFHNGGYLSRILIDDKYTYLMHNDEFLPEEIQGINAITALLTEKVQEQKRYWEEVLESVKR